MIEKQQRLNQIHAFFVACLLIGLFFRFYNLGGWLRFTGDEARDVLAAYEITQGIRFPIQGPKIHIGFGFLGPAYYYLLALPLWISGGSPAAAGWLSALFDLGAAFIFFFLVKKLFDRQTAWIALSLYLISFQIIFYARWGWHPSLVPFFTLLSIYGSLQITDGESRWAPATLLSFSIALQLHLTVVVLAVPIAIALWIGRKHLHPAMFLFGIVVSSLPFLPLIQFEITNDYPNVRGALALFSFQQASAWENPIPFLINSLSPISTLEIVHKSIQLIPGGRLSSLFNGILFGFGLLLLVQSEIKERYRLILASWFILPVLALFLYSGFRPDYYLISWFSLPILTIAYGLSWLFDRKEYQPIAIVLGIGLLGINGATGSAYFQWMGDRGEEYSFYHGLPLQAREEIIEQLAAEEADIPFDVTLVTWAWPNHQPYLYLLHVEANSPTMIDLYESLNGESGPFITHSIQSDLLSDRDARSFEKTHFIIKEPDTLPLPPELRQAIKIGEFGQTGLYRLP